MAESQKKKSNEQIVEEYLKKNSCKEGSITGGSIVGQNLLDISYLVVHEEGFDVYYLKDNKITATKAFSWDDFTEVTVDHYAMSSLFRFSGKVNISIKAVFSDRLLKEIKKNNISCMIQSRKWYNKIIGFRSRKKWKMLLSSIIYISVLLFIVTLFNGNDDDNQEKANSKSTEQLTSPKKQAEEATSSPEKEENKTEHKENSKQSKSAKEFINLTKKDTEFRKYVNKFYSLPSNIRSSIYDKYVYKHTVTWKGTVADFFSDTIIVYGGESKDYNNEDWASLSSEKAELLPFVFIAELKDRSQIKNITMGQTLQVKGEIGSRGDIDFKSNWKLYKGEIIN